MDRCSASIATICGLMLCPKPSVGEWTGEPLGIDMGLVKIPLCDTHMSVVMAQLPITAAHYARLAAGG